VKLSSIARSLQQKIPLIKIEDRLSRNLAAEELEIHLGERWRKWEAGGWSASRCSPALAHRLVLHPQFLALPLFLAWHG
jgi:hypothetical protein